MSDSAKIRRARAPVPVSRISQARKMNRLKDDVYREMLLLEVNRPGAEMGLAVALLRAVVHSEGFDDREEFKGWLRTICPLGLRLIETSLSERTSCDASTITKSKSDR